MNHPSFITIILGILGPLLGLSCAGNHSPSTATRPPAQPAAVRATSSSVEPGSSSVPDIARREVIRRKEMIRQMDEAAIRASQRMAEDDLEGAVDGYRRAIGQ